MDALIKTLSDVRWCFLLTALLVMVLSPKTGFAQGNHWPSAVVSVEYGTGAGFGQEYFPDNILGPPDSTATASAPSSSPQELLSLGTNGEIILIFEGGIVNGPGADLTVFENPFLYGDPPRSFAETGIVAVSVDGEVWYEFPWSSETFEGLAGVTPTHGASNPLDPLVSGGDSFDLADLVLEIVYQVRITDSGDSVEDSGPSFDLDAVAAIYTSEWQAVNPSEIPFTCELDANLYPNPFNSTLHMQMNFSGNPDFQISMYDLLGREILSERVNSTRWSWQAQNLVSGTYMVRIQTVNGKSLTRTVTLVK